MEKSAISTVDLTKRFGDVLAVDHIDLKVPRGSIWGLIGPNGAGKTTTINMLSGLYRPTSGTIEILGERFNGTEVSIKKNFGVMLEKLGLYESLTGEEFLTLIGYIFDIEKMDLKKRINELFEYMELIPARRRPIHQYSQGMKKKLALAGILLHEPRIIFLDEPFENLDPLATRKIQDTLSAMARKGSTIFLTSHILSTVEKFCSEVALMIQGRIVFVSPTDRIRDRIKDELTREHYDDLEDVFLSFVEKEEDERQKFRLSWI